MNKKEKLTFILILFNYVNFFTILLIGYIGIFTIFSIQNVFLLLTNRQFFYEGIAITLSNKIKSFINFDIKMKIKNFDVLNNRILKETMVERKPMEMAERQAVEELENQFFDACDKKYFAKISSLVNIYFRVIRTGAKYTFVDYAKNNTAEKFSYSTFEGLDIIMESNHKISKEAFGFENKEIITSVFDLNFYLAVSSIGYRNDYFFEESTEFFINFLKYTLNFKSSEVRKSVILLIETSLEKLNLSFSEEFGNDYENNVYINLYKNVMSSLYKKLLRIILDNGKQNKLIDSFIDLETLIKDFNFRNNPAEKEDKLKDIIPFGLIEKIYIDYYK